MTITTATRNAIPFTSMAANVFAPGLIRGLFKISFAQPAPLN